jgi:hypothetical protein
MMTQIALNEMYLQIADALGDVPQTTISVHLLRRNLCHAYLLGSLDTTWGAIVHNYDVLEEPTAYGNSPQKMWELLQQINGWGCVNVDEEVAESLGELIEQNIGVGVRYYGDIYYSLTQTVKKIPNDDVRLMTTEDIPLLEAVAGGLHPPGFGNLETLLNDGFVACAIVDNKVVATVHTYACTENHAEIGAETHADYRKRGYATAAAALIIEQVQASGQIPVWSTGEDNYASMKVAEKLGFKKVSPRAYVILER